jgi:cation diffusion facilitator CzcD-associated flavoprotein CzcO
MNFNSKITKAEWNDDLGKWKIEVNRRKDGVSTSQVSEDACDVFLYATGALNGAKWPDDIVNDLEKFQGRIIHSSAWPLDYQKEQWQKERIAVIGVGASSLQIVTAMQPYAKHIDVFVRTGTWFSRIAENFGEYNPYSEDERASFRQDPETLVSHTKKIEEDLSICLDIQIAGSEAQEGATNWTRTHMREHLKDDRLYYGFVPSFGLGCRRITPGNAFMKAIQQPNVDVHFAAAKGLTTDSIIDSTSAFTPIDTIICASGFDTSYRPRFPIIGRGGVNLAHQWSNHPEAYLGITVPDMPNFFMFMGPSWPVHNGSIMGPLIATGDYVIEAINKIQRDCLKSLSPCASATKAFNDHVQAFAKKTVWVQECRSWFKNGEGRVTALWPGSALHFMEAVKWPRWEDYEIESSFGNENKWKILGNGFTWAERQAGEDKTPFLNIEAIDERWRKAVFTEKERSANNIKS